MKAVLYSLWNEPVFVAAVVTAIVAVVAPSTITLVVGAVAAVVARHYVTPVTRARNKKNLAHEVREAEKVGV